MIHEMITLKLQIMIHETIIIKIETQTHKLSQKILKLKHKILINKIYLFSLATLNKLLIIYDIFYILYKNNMLFDFNAFIGELRENSEKKEIIEKYEAAL